MPAKKIKKEEVKQEKAKPEKVKKTAKKEVKEKTKETAVKKAPAKKKVEIEEKPKAKKVRSAAKKSDNNKVEEPVVAAELEIVEETKKVAPSTYRNIGTFSADIENEFIYNSTSRAEEEDWSYKFMRKCKYNGEILVGKVVGIEDDPKKLMLGVRLSYEPRYTKSHYGVVEVLIPEMCFFEPERHFAKDYDKKPDIEKYRIRKSTILQYLGAKIHFCVIGVSREITDDIRFAGQYVTSVIGNRTMAMEKLRDKYFFHENRKRTDKSPITIKEGDLVEGFVVTVADQYVTVVSLGVETRVHLNDLSQDNITSCFQYTSVGDVLPELRIRSIEISGKSVKLRLTSRKALAPKTILSMKKGNYYCGKVAWYNKQKDLYTIYLDNGVTAFVYRNNVMGFVDLSINDTVSVCVTTLLDDKVGGNAIKL